MSSESSTTVLTSEEFVVYSSPRYYRLIFDDLKPKTKNGDLISALSELKRGRIVTPATNWDQIILTQKGVQLKALIQRLLQENALHVPQSDGLFDYKSEIGRKALLELIRFLSMRLNLKAYFAYLNLPVLESEQTTEWNALFGPDWVDKINYLSKEGREKLVQFLTTQPKKLERKTNAMQNSFSSHTMPITLNLNLIKRFLRKFDLQRPEPFFNHLNSCEPPLFSVKERKLTVNVSDLLKLSKLLKDHLSDYKTSDNQWLNEYFQLLTLPIGKSGFLGFQAPNTLQYFSKTDAFLNLAIEGPRILASQYSVIEELGELREIIFPVNVLESMVICNSNLDIHFFFTIPSDQCVFKISQTMISLKTYPENYISSRGSKDFGDLISRSRTLEEAREIQELCQSLDPDDRKNCALTLRSTKSAIQEKIERLSRCSASLVTICQMITMKFNQEFALTKCFCLFENGIVTLVDIGGIEKILTTITIGKIEYGSELRKAMTKIASAIFALKTDDDLPLEQDI